MSAEDDYLKWRRGEAIGCFFARSITAKKPANFGQIIETIDDTLAATDLAKRIAEVVEKGVANAKVVAMAILMPKVGSLDLLTETAIELGKIDKWAVTPLALAATPAGNLIGFQITRQLPFENGELPSEALVLGPFPECFPETRRAPVTAMEIFVGKPMLLDPKSQEPSTKANVAHMEMNMLPDAFEIMWKLSEEGRTQSLGRKVDARAKAKIAFVVPPEIAAKFGVNV